MTSIPRHRDVEGQVVVHTQFVAPLLLTASISLLACEPSPPANLPSPLIRAHYRESGSLDIFLVGTEVCGKWPGGEAYCTAAFKTDQYFPVSWIFNAAQIEFGEFRSPLGICTRSRNGIVKCGYTLQRSEDESSLAEVFGLQNDILDLSVGYQHACAVRSNGTVRCWGKNDQGQLGDGTNIDSKEPVTVKGLSDIVDVDAYWESSCALRKTGSVVCWGENGAGQLGDGTTKSQNIPVEVQGVVGARQVEVGQSSACALLENGTVQCWGQAKPSFGEDALAESVPLLENVASIVVGSSHGCARLENGRVRCWGNNQQGQLGDGTRVRSRSHPSNVVGLNDAVQLVAHGSNTCARLSSGAIRCWGSGYASRQYTLGQTHLGEPIPLNIEGGKQLAAGYFHTCTLTTKGEVFCWGDNTYGQLGDEKQMIRAFPARVANLDNVVRIRASDSRTCALKADGTLWCWGGDVGPKNSARTPLRPFPEKVFEGVADFYLSERRMYSRVDTCARRRDGSIWCWLDDPMDGPAKRMSPQMIPRLANAVQMALGGKYACGLLPNGEVRCLDDYVHTLLHQRATISPDLIVTVQGLPQTTRIATRLLDTCAVTSDEREYCWGGVSRPSDSHGSLGAIQAIPAEQLRSTGPICSYPPSRDGWQIHGLCTLLWPGDETCMESSSDGRPELLEGRDLNALPRKYAKYEEIQQYVLGSDHGCVLRRNGEIICRGHSQFGQLGNGVIHGEWLAE